MRSDSRLCEWSYPKARLYGGLRVSWTPRAGLEPAPVRWTCRTEAVEPDAQDAPPDLFTIGWSLPVAGANRSIDHLRWEQGRVRRAAEDEGNASLIERGRSSYRGFDGSCDDDRRRVLALLLPLAAVLLVVGEALTPKGLDHRSRSCRPPRRRFRSRTLTRASSTSPTCCVIFGLGCAGVSFADCDCRRVVGTGRLLQRLVDVLVGHDLATAVTVDMARLGLQPRSS